MNLRKAQIICNNIETQYGVVHSDEEIERVKEMLRQEENK